ncbi:MAG: hypothetical protein K2Q10_01520 [Rhodospirillales bacterium]|nr:hypothetical protein [Rhodospirillales bacterium]
MDIGGTGNLRESLTLYSAPGRKPDTVTHVPEASLETQARRLLEPGERDVPPTVVETLSVCRLRGMWALLARNPAVYSCRDAANNRYRLGQVGIPLEDEMKSYLSEFRSPNGKRIFVMLHCRADRIIDFDKIKAAGLPIGDLRRAVISEIDDEALGYGLINPFRAEAILPDKALFHVFDTGLFSDSSVIGTMMTNAGDRTWGIEFHPQDLLAAIPEHRRWVIDFTVGEYGESAKIFPGIGIITGNAPESGMLLWDKINHIHKRWLGDDFHGDTSYPYINVQSIPHMGLSMELDRRSSDLWKILEKKVDTMIDAGVRILAVACNTTQYYSDLFQERLDAVGGRFISAAPVVGGFIRAQAPRKVLLLGIGYSASLGEWSGYRDLRDIDNLIRPDKKMAECLSRLAYLVKSSGPNGVAYQQLRGILRHSDADVALLLLTELSMIHARYPRWPGNPIRIVDSLDLYAQSIHEAARQYLK